MNASAWEEKEIRGREGWERVSKGGVEGGSECVRKGMERGMQGEGETTDTVQSDEHRSREQAAQASNLSVNVI